MLVSMCLANWSADDAGGGKGASEASMLAKVLRIRKSQEQHRQ